MTFYLSAWWHHRQHFRYTSILSCYVWYGAVEKREQFWKKQDRWCLYMPPLFCFVENILALCEVRQIWLSPIKIALITFFILSVCSCTSVCIYMSLNAPSNTSLFLQNIIHFCSFNTVDKTGDSNVNVIIILCVKNAETVLPFIKGNYSNFRQWRS